MNTPLNFKNCNMTKDTFISFVRLVKKLHTMQQDSVSKGHGYLGMLEYSNTLALKVDAQLKFLNRFQEQHYAWLTLFVDYTRIWRSNQKQYQETKYDSLLQKCRETDRIIERGFLHIKANSADVLTTISTQMSLEW